MIDCPLCGHRFEEGAESACSACPMQRECATICCPNCGYQFVERSWIVEKFRAFRKSVAAGRSGRDHRTDGA